MPASNGTLVVNVALPPASSATVRARPLLEVNVTVPVGTPAPGATGATLALMVTCSPKAEGFGEDVTVVVVDARPT
ncbi:hypothetical protein ADK74_12585 [Streptomyces decoyicus]|nr:hypothetical protein ADK74_12585 [Streptomyces decoyicus]